MQEARVNNDTKNGVVRHFRLIFLAKKCSVICQNKADGDEYIDSVGNSGSLLERKTALI